MILNGTPISNSNTTLVKVKLSIGKEQDVQCKNSNTTLVKVKFQKADCYLEKYRIQIQHLLKLNCRTL